MKHSVARPSAAHAGAAWCARLLRRRTAAQLAAALLAAAGLAGCGGGGSGGGGSSADAVDVQAAGFARTESVTKGSSASPKPVTTTVKPAFDAAGWSIWTKTALPVYSGPYSLVGDPSVLRDGTLLRMYHTCYDPVRQGPAICQVTSLDGKRWTPVDVGDPLPGRMLQTRPGQWDDTHETPLAIKFNGEYLLYFAGYQDRGGHLKSFPIQLGLASSSDGVHFTRVADDPVMTVTPGGFDSEAVFSPSIVEYQGQLVMLYTGYCLDSCTRTPGVYLMAATSTDGRHWVKTGQPVISAANFPTGVTGIAEAHVMQGPDNRYVLFATYLYPQGQGHEIGIGRAASPLGPWELSPTPIIRKSASGFDDIGPIAPSVLIENGMARMWFHGFSTTQQINIGYAESPLPLHAP